MGGLYRLRPGPVRDFGTERALAEPLGPNTTNFPSSCPRFTLLTELNLSLKARPEAHTFEFIGSGPSEKSGAPQHTQIVCCFRHSYSKSMLSHQNLNSGLTYTVSKGLYTVVVCHHR